MNLEHFPLFLKKNYPMVYATPEEMAQIGIDFKAYLEEKFKPNSEKLEEVWNIDPMYVFKNLVNKHPFMVNGYHPVIFIHFDNFVKEQIELAKQEQKD